jgi:hypothetical protein
LPKVMIDDSGLPTDPYEQFIRHGYLKADSLGWSGLDQTDDEEEAVSLCYTRYAPCSAKTLFRRALIVCGGNELLLMVLRSSTLNHLFLSTLVERPESPRVCFTLTAECTCPHWAMLSRLN